MSDPVFDHTTQLHENIKRMGEDKDLISLSRIWSRLSNNYFYTYNYSWLGRPIIQYPQDLLALQEIIWRVQPDLIIETGIAHGGSLIFYASMLELIAICGGPTEAKVLGLDIEIKEHNKKAIEKHPLFHRIMMIEGNSISTETREKVGKIAFGGKKVLVCLDSNHTHEHVLAELHAYTPFIHCGSYCVVFDTLIEDMPDDSFSDRPWGKGNNPKTAVWDFMKTTDRFVIDKEIENKLLITVAPDGFLKCIKD